MPLNPSGGRISGCVVLPEDTRELLLNGCCRWWIEANSARSGPLAGRRFRSEASFNEVRSFSHDRVVAIDNQILLVHILPI